MNEGKIMISLRRLAGEVSVTLNLSSLFAPKSPFLFVLLLDQHFDKKILLRKKVWRGSDQCVYASKAKRP